jgi:hypothetical protein
MISILNHDLDSEKWEKIEKTFLISYDHSVEIQLEL